VACIFLTSSIYSQSYHAIAASPYAGAISFYNNPASPVNSAYKWDLALFSGQLSSSNSAVYLRNASLLNFDKIDLQIEEGYKPRTLHGNADMNLLNFHFKLNPKQAFSFGVRGRTYDHFKTGPFNYTDSIVTFQDFLSANNNTDKLEGFFTHSAWMEINFNYSQVLLETPTSRLTGGITLGIIKPVSGAHGNIQNFTFQELKDNNNQPYHVATGGSSLYEYSSNYNRWDSTKDALSNVKNFMTNLPTALTISAGVEYLIKDDYDYRSLSPTNYNWKFGASLMDFGTSTFNHGTGSYYANLPQANMVIDTGMFSYWYNRGSYKKLKDSLVQSFSISDSLRSTFTIANPARLILYADKNLGNNFFVSAELNINLYAAQVSNKLKTRELNLFTITPRWETKQLGAYMPIQVNTEGQLWVGAALKVGPLLVGVHNLNITQWFKTGTQTFNSGGYILLSVHPFGNKKPVEDFDCPRW
jgi:hypothetical protein